MGPKRLWKGRSWNLAFKKDVVRRGRAHMIQRKWRCPSSSSPLVWNWSGPAAGHKAELHYLNSLSSQDCSVPWDG